MLLDELRNPSFEDHSLMVKLTELQEKEISLQTKIISTILMPPSLIKI